MNEFYCIPLWLKSVWECQVYNCKPNLSRRLLAPPFSLRMLCFSNIRGWWMRCLQDEWLQGPHIPRGRIGGLEGCDLPVWTAYWLFMGFRSHLSTCHVLVSHEHVLLPCSHGNTWLANNCFKRHYYSSSRTVYWYIVTDIWNNLACLYFLPGGLIGSDFHQQLKLPGSNFTFLSLSLSFWKVTNMMWALIFLKSRNQRTQMLPVPEEQAGVRQMECTVLSPSQLTYTELGGKEVTMSS